MFSPALAHKTSAGVGVYTVSLLGNSFQLLIAVLQLLIAGQYSIFPYHSRNHR